MKVLEQVRQVAARRPEEVKWSAIGGAIGVPVGLTIGGVGVAALGGAVGVPAFFLCSVVGATIGNRYGVEKDRPLPKKDGEESS